MTFTKLLKSSSKARTFTLVLSLFLLSCFSLASTAGAAITVGSEPFLCDFTDLAQALWLAPDGATIELAAGTYKFDRLSIGRSVWISGGHDGCGGPVLQGAVSILDGKKAHQVMDIGAGEPITVILQRLELRDGRGFPLGVGPNNGAGLRSFGPVQLALVDVTFRNNLALYGGGLAIHSSVDGRPDVVVVRSKFLFNQALETVAGIAPQGGAIHCDDASLRINASTFSNNVSASEGGAIYASECGLQILNSQLDHNQASQTGGAIHSLLSLVQLGEAGDRDLTLTDNHAVRGGAVYSLDTKLTIKGTDFARNSAKNGGAIHANFSGVSVGKAPCVAGGCVRFEDNDAEVTGGALALSNSDAKLFGVVGDGNAAVGNGAFLFATSDQQRHIRLSSSVVTSGEGKSQIYTRLNGMARVVSSTIFNNPSLHPVLDMDDELSLVSHVIFSGNGGSPTHQDPDVFSCNLIDGPFAPPANSIGTFFGNPLFVAPGDYHLQLASPAVDACAFGLYEAENRDLEGDSRPDAVMLNDIGADELVNQ